MSNNTTKLGSGMYAQYVGQFECDPACAKPGCESSTCYDDGMWGAHDLNGACECGCTNPDCKCQSGECVCLDKESGDNVPHEGAFCGAFQQSRDGCCCGGCDSDNCQCGSCATNNDCGCVCGAADVIIEYESGKYDKAKEKIIQEILEAARAIGVKFTGETTQEKIKSLLAAIPTGDRFKKDVATHSALCKSLAEKINKAHGSEIIDASDPEFICQQIAEMLISLNSSMYNEFVGVYTDVKAVIRNMKILQKIMSDIIGDVENAANQIEQDGGDSSQLKERLSFYNSVSAELNRQIYLLENLLNAQVPDIDKKIAELYAMTRDSAAGIKNINYKMGSDKFGQIIHQTLHGMGITAALANEINTALKRIGMTMAEYGNATKSSLIQKATDKLITEKLSEEDSLRFFKALKLLKRNLYRAAEINNYKGSAEPAQIFPKTATEKKHMIRSKTRDLLMESFASQINEQFNMFIMALNAIADRVGKDIPLSDQLDGFRDAIARLRDNMFQYNNLFYMLISYYNDALSMQKRADAIGNLKMISNFLESILEMPLYSNSKQFFAAAQQNIKNILALIDKYSEEVVAKFGKGEDSDDDENDNKRDQYDGGRQRRKHNKKSKRGGDAATRALNVKIFKSTKSIEDALLKFDYAYKNSQMYQNLASRSDELSKYAVKYAEMTASAIADILKKEQVKYKIMLESIEETFTNISSITNKTDSIFGDTVDKINEQKAAAQQFLNSQWKAKQNFYATLEAVDEYMRVFTDNLVKNPADIKDIQLMLDEMTILDDWYQDKTGNILLQVFESFPHEYTKSGVTNNEVAPSNLKIGIDNGAQYYKIVKDALNGNANPGNPFLAIVPVNAVKAKKILGSFFDNFLLLKNLMNIFLCIGNKFCGEELRKKVFLTPIQIYGNLVEYLQASAFSQGINLKLERCVPLNNADYLKPEARETRKTIDTFKYEKEDNYDNLNKTYFNNNNIIDGVVLGFGAAAPDADPNSDISKAALGMQRYGVIMNSALKDFRTNIDIDVDANVSMFEGYSFQKEDTYFMHMIKSMCAKIFTILGMYDVVDRPSEYHGLTPIRMILGGSYERPKVDAAATALYFRLPLLAMFYHQLFIEQWEADIPRKGSNPLRNKNDNTVKISLIPDFEGTFSGLIDLIFNRNCGIKLSNYTEENVCDLIRECNFIYQRMFEKFPQNTINNAINEFVNEINRRFGIVSMADSQMIQDMKDERYAYKKGISTEYMSSTEYNAQYPILPGEEDDEPRKLSAAQKLLGASSFAPIQLVENPYTISNKHWQLLKNFRCKIDRYFDKIDSKQMFSFNAAIKTAQRDLAAESRDDERIKIVARLIRGKNVLDNIDNSKYLLFHETVVAGLNTLSAIHTMLARFRARICAINPNDCLKAMFEYYASKDEILSINKGEEITRIRDKLIENKVSTSDDDLILTIIMRILGYSENCAMNGGNFNVHPDDGFVQNAAATNTSINSSTHIIRDTAVNNVQMIFVEKKSDKDRINGTFLETLVSQNKYKEQTNGEKIFTSSRNANSIFEVMQSQYTGNNDNSPYLSIYKYLVGLSVKDAGRAVLQSSTKDQSWLDIGTQIFRRYIFDNDAMRAELIDALIGLGNDFQELVTVKIESGTISINYGALKEVINDLFANIGRFIEVFRPYISPEIMFKYTDKYMPGSYYWLQEQLNEKLLQPCAKSIVGTKDKINDIESLRSYISLAKCIEKANETYSYLETEYIVFPGADAGDQCTSASGKFPYEIIKDTPNNKQFRAYNTSGNLLASLIYYDANKPNSGVLNGMTTGEGIIGRIDNRYNMCPIEGLRETRIKYDPYESLLCEFDGSHRVIDLKYATRFSQLYSWDCEFNLNRSLMFAFNQLIAKFIYCFYDRGASKMYINLLSDFVNNKFNNDIFNAFNTFADVAPCEFLAQTSTGPREFKEKARLDEIDAWENGIQNNNNGFGLHVRSNGIYSIGGRDSRLIGVQGSKGNDQQNVSNYLNNFCERADVTPQTILYTSLAKILSNIITYKNKQGQLQYVIDNPADIPQYMKETMRANLPAFKNLFHELMSRAEFIRRIVSDAKGLTRGTNNTDSQFNLKSGVATDGTFNPWPYNLKPASATTDYKAQYQSIIDQISKGCQAFINGCDQVLKEIGDSPFYLETFQGSLKEYKAMRGNEPLTPISTILSPLQNTNKSNYMDFFPCHTIGSEQFKFLYGTRGILADSNKKVSLEQLPGLVHICEMFNNSVDTRFACSKELLESYTINLVKLNRYLFQLKQVKGLLSPHLVGIGALTSQVVANKVFDPTSTISYNSGSFVKDDLIVTQFAYGSTANLRANMPKSAQNIYNGRYIITNVSDVSLVAATSQEEYAKILDLDSEDIKFKQDGNKVTPAPIVYQLTHKLYDTIRLTENLEKEESVKAIVEQFNTEKATHNDIVIQNILDLNIVPINVHALMREIPLVNLYNYSYTFDKLMVDLFYGNDSASKNRLFDMCNQQINSSNQRNALELLVSLLLDPYQNIAQSDLVGLGNMLAGGQILDDSTNYHDRSIHSNEIAHPKFLRDQLFDKLLFGDLTFAENDFNPSKTNNNSLIYYDNNKPQKVSPTGQNAQILKIIGTLRFDTIFIRNLIFIINAFRVVRMKLHRDLVYSKDIILKSAPLTRMEITEYSTANPPKLTREKYNVRNRQF